MSDDAWYVVAGVAIAAIVVVWVRYLDRKYLEEDDDSYR